MQYAFAPLKNLDILGELVYSCHFITKINGFVNHVFSTLSSQHVIYFDLDGKELLTVLNITEQNHNCLGFA